ncbi:MAG: flagellar hook-associated protein FlgK [Verrucomicrobia bacterium GWC2_42_7]|nr:MAG: flagellar hook-associated protein FlgK [Verrucomicrobia bacterium GWC2_42_7]
MAGLYSTLTKASQALDAQSTCIAIVANNLANVDNPGYSRQKALVGSIGSAKMGDGTVENLGIEVQGIQQFRDSVLDTQVMKGAMRIGSYDAQVKYNANLSLTLAEDISRQGASGDISATDSTVKNSTSSLISAFFNAFSGAAATPNTKGNVITAAQNLVNKLNTTSGQLVQLSSNLDQQISQDVKTVNNLLSQLAKLNESIGNIEMGIAGTALDLRDQRQTMLEGLAKYLDFTVSTSDDNNKMTLSVNTPSGGSYMLVDDRTLNGTIAYNASANSFYVGSTQLDIGQGSLAGEVTVKTGNVQDLITATNNLAKAFVTEVNSRYNPGGSLGYNFFDATKISAATICLDGNLSANWRTTTLGSGNTGATELMQAVANLQTISISIGGSSQTISDYYIAQVTNFALQANSVQNLDDSENTAQKMLSKQRASSTGVSMNQEVTDLLKYQRAFQSSAKLINVLDELLNTVVNGLVR